MVLGVRLDPGRCGVVSGDHQRNGRRELLVLLLLVVHAIAEVLKHAIVGGP